MLAFHKEKNAEATLLVTKVHLCLQFYTFICHHTQYVT